jgi:acylphosphatase
MPERSEETAVRWIVVGRVQGVGYRYFARQAGTAAGVRGWIRNLPDGSCEVQVAGPPEAVQRFKEDLARGPRGSRVDDIDEERVTPDPSWRGFQIAF